MSKNGGRTPTGVHSVQNRSCRRGISVASGGRPESETDTPANIGNGPYRDNGEGVAATPLPYPLEDLRRPGGGCIKVRPTRRIRWIAGLSREFFRHHRGVVSAETKGVVDRCVHR